MKTKMIPLLLSLTLLASGAWSVAAAEENTPAIEEETNVAVEGAAAGSEGEAAGEEQPPAADPSSESGSESTGDSSSENGSSQDTETGQNPSENMEQDAAENGSDPTTEETDTEEAGSGEETVDPAEDDPSQSENEETTSESGAQDPTEEAESTSSSEETEASSSEEEAEKDAETAEAENAEEAPAIVSFQEIGSFTVDGGTSLEAVLGRLPSVVIAILKDESEIEIPVRWVCEIPYDGAVEGYYTFCSAARENDDGTPYEIGHPFAEGVEMPRVAIRVEAILPEGVQMEAVVMDDVTGAHLGVYEGEKVVFEFLVRKLKLNYAAACGIMANIAYESNFNSHAIGDGGTSYGICQWHLGRYSALVDFCKKRKLPYGSLEGQLRYLQYELEHNYKHVLDYLHAVPNTDVGAFQAGYYWCFHFERPANIYAQSNLRGNAAKNSYWPRYHNYRIKAWLQVRRDPMKMYCMEM